ncbi:MAG TPA: hypothetical protein VI385_04160 [Flavisolibacter sp.]|jgi:uncharacterized protein involved in exopolysaccharide biosynthesis
MNNGKEQMQVEFNGKATSVFFSIYRGFETAVANVSRRRDEYKFQQLKKQYATTMEHELQEIARELLVKHKNEKQLSEMDQMFKQFIKDYMHRFIQKVNDL